MLLEAAAIATLPADMPPAAQLDRLVHLDHLAKVVPRQTLALQATTRPDRPVIVLALNPALEALILLEPLGIVQAVDRIRKASSTIE